MYVFFNRIVQEEKMNEKRIIINDIFPYFSFCLDGYNRNRKSYILCFIFHCRS